MPASQSSFNKQRILSLKIHPIFFSTQTSQWNGRRREENHIFNLHNKC